MKAIVITSPGEPSVLQLQERPQPGIGADEFAYGEQPNNYLKEQLEKLAVGTILFPAEGEGRNAVLQPNLGGLFQHLT